MKDMMEVVREWYVHDFLVHGREPDCKHPGVLNICSPENSYASLAIPWSTSATVEQTHCRKLLRLWALLRTLLRL